MRCFFILALINSTLTFAQPLKVLFLGNSYTGVNNLPQLVHDVATSAGDSLVFSSNTPGGYTLDDHSNDSTSMNLIMQGIWDYVVLQEQSQIPAFEEWISGGPQYLTHQVAKYNGCTRMMYYMTWGRKNGDQSNCPNWPPMCTYEGMDSMLNLNYMETALITKSLVSPVGRVWNRIRHLYPTIELYQSDESHPSEAGSYAAACCFYASLFKSDPLNITFDYTLTATDAAIIRQVAKEVVFDSLGLFDFTSHNPVSMFNYWIGTGNNEIVLYNQSTGADYYLWDFGDGDTSTLMYPHHSYLNDGNYIVTLTAIDCDLDSVYQSVYQLPVSFCSYTPVIYPDTAILCPGNMDSLWTQQYDSYQWLDELGDTLVGETNRYFAPSQGINYSVITSLNGCVERSVNGVVASYLHNLVIYSVDSTFIPDTVCTGDSTVLYVWPNKPAPPYYINHWYQNGNPINGDPYSVVITSPGVYHLEVENQICPGFIIYQSPDVRVDFFNCNISVPEYESSKMEIFPSLVEDKIFIKLKTVNDVHYEIFDIFGRIIMEGKIASGNFINVAGLKSGTYIIKSGTHDIRFVKL